MARRRIRPRPPAQRNIRERVSTHYAINSGRTLVRGGAGGGSRWVKLKRIPRLAPVLALASIEASAVHLRILAEESRELIVDKLLAAPPSVTMFTDPVTRRAYRVQGLKTVKRPPMLRRPRFKASERRPYRHRALAHRTVLQKLRAGEDGRKLLATGEYIEGIEVVKGKQTPHGVYYMVRTARRLHGPSGLPLSLIARIHEYGSAVSRIPARPHWGPATRAVIRRKNQMGHAVRAEALRRAMRALT